MLYSSGSTNLHTIVILFLMCTILMAVYNKRLCTYDTQGKGQRISMN